MKQLLFILSVLISVNSFGQFTLKAKSTDSSKLVIKQGAIPDTVTYVSDLIGDTLSSTLYVLKAGSYDNPAWVNSLAASKITGLSAGTVTSISAGLPIRVTSPTTTPVLSIDTGYGGVNRMTSIGGLLKVRDSLQTNITAKVSSQWATVSGTNISYTAALPFVDIITSDATALYGLRWRNNTTTDAYIEHNAGSGEWQFSNGRSTSWGGFYTIKADLTTIMTIKKSGVGYGAITNPTAFVHFPPPSATAGTAAIKIPQGTLLTTPEAGVFGENDGTDFYGTPTGTTRYVLLKGLKGSATLDFPSTAAQTSSELTITVTGAADGDDVLVSPLNASSNANSCFTGRVSATNTVTVKFNNYSASAIDPASGVFKVTVIR